MMQEKKGMMKVWNMVLVATTFFLCIFGTFLTRSGVVSSVHAFAESPIGKYFVGFLALGIAATIYLILDRLDYLKSESELESVVSRESSFLFNNLLLLASCFAVLWGTLFPVISEAVTNEKISSRRPLVQSPDDPDRARPAVPHRRRAAVRLAPHVHRKPAPQLPDPRRAGLRSGCRPLRGGYSQLLGAHLFRLLPVRASTIVSEFFKGAAPSARRTASTSRARWSSSRTATRAGMADIWFTWASC